MTRLFGSLSLTIIVATGHLESKLIIAPLVRNGRVIPWIGNLYLRTSIDNTISRCR